MEDSLEDHELACQTCVLLLDQFRRLLMVVVADLPQPCPHCTCWDREGQVRCGSKEVPHTRDLRVLLTQDE
eukprot:9250690-Prorocentrum_lima.AAC.1